MYSVSVCWIMRKKIQWYKFEMFFCLVVCLFYWLLICCSSNRKCRPFKKLYIFFFKWTSLIKKKKKKMTVRLLNLPSPPVLSLPPSYSYSVNIYNGKRRVVRWNKPSFVYASWIEENVYLKFRQLWKKKIKYPLLFLLNNKTWIQLANKLYPLQEINYTNKN